MNNEEIIEKTRAFIEQKFRGGESAHDYWHMYRVWQLAKSIAHEEKSADSFVVELAALLHDIADHKFYNGDREIGPRKAREWLEDMRVEGSVISHVEDIIRNMSFSSSRGKYKNDLNTIEGQIVHDADKLDAIGAIGIGRVFIMSGGLGLSMHNPEPTLEEKEDEQTQKWGISSVQHFYDKLLLLKGRMFTETGKRMAEHRHKYMEDYLKEFYAEWEGKV
jgi:uncharacterized protein